MWKRIKLHAAVSNYTSPQKLVENILEEWLLSHPLSLGDVDSINATQNPNPNGGN